MENHGNVVSRETIMEKLWESDSFIDDNTLTVNVTRLCRKLETIGMKEFIQTKKESVIWYEKENAGGISVDEKTDIPFCLWGLLFMHSWGGCMEKRQKRYCIRLFCGFCLQEGSCWQAFPLSAERRNS